MHRICTTFELRTGCGRKFSAGKPRLVPLRPLNSSTEIIRSVAAWELVRGAWQNCQHPSSIFDEYCR